MGFQPLLQIVNPPMHLLFLIDTRDFGLVCVLLSFQFFLQIFTQDLIVTLLPPSGKIMNILLSLIRMNFHNFVYFIHIYHS